MKNVRYSISALVAGLLGAMLALPAVSEPRCDSHAATLETAEGPIRWQASPDEEWLAVPIGFRFCYGERVQTLKHRAALRLSNDTLVRLNENSAIHFLPEQESFFVELLNGAAHFLSRTKKRFEVKAPYMNAAVDGTEFSVEADEQANSVAVFEGEVNVHTGEHLTRLRNGQRTSTDAKQQPGPVERISLHNAASWTLHYPPIFSTNSTSAAVRAHIDSANYAAAIASLQQSPAPADLALAASLKLIEGDWNGAVILLRQARDSAPQSADILAVESFISVVKGQPKAALVKTTELVKRSADNVNALLAHSFALQANGEIEQALVFARRANRAAPASVPVMARYAELLLTNGQPDQAAQLLEQALSRSPRHPRLHTLMGYVGLSQLDRSLAVASFTAALNNNPNSALAHFGLGLSDVLSGNLAQSRAKMELATLLDPTNSLFRSYLGKTYLELKLPSWAQPQFELAKEFDPNDPTPWFYEADLQQQSNQWVHALTSVDTAIKKNDNRAIYRPRSMLQSDALVRGNNKQQILHKLNLAPAGQLASGLAASEAPGEFAAHQAASLSFINSGYDRLVASEVMKARLLKPILAKPLGVGLESPGLTAPRWLMPSKMAVQEHANLYSANGVSGHFALQGGDHNTQSAVWQMQAAGDHLSVDAGQIFTQSDGFTQNNDLDLRIGQVNLHYRPSDQLKLVLSGTNSEEDNGDLDNAIDGPLFSLANRESVETQSIDAGLIYQPSAATRLIWHSSHLEKDTLNTTFVDFVVPTDSVYQLNETLYQHQFVVNTQFEPFDLTIGGVRQKVDGLGIDEFIPDIFGAGKSQIEEHAKKTQLFASIDVPVQDNLNTYGEISYSKYRSDSPDAATFKEDETDYVLAANWNVSPGLRFSLANWTSTADYLINSTTLKTTHIYGIPLINDQIRFDHAKASALAVFGTLGSWQYSTMVTDTRLTQAEIASLRYQVSQVRNEQIKGDVHILRRFGAGWLYHLRLQAIESEIPFAGNVNQVDRPKLLRTGIVTTGFAFDALPHLHLGVNAQFVHQESGYPALDAAGETATDTESEGALIWNTQALYKPIIRGPEISLRVLNLNNQRLSINQDFVSGGANVASAQRKIIPYGRLALLAIQWSL